MRNTYCANPRSKYSRERVFLWSIDSMASLRVSRLQLCRELIFLTLSVWLLSFMSRLYLLSYALIYWPAPCFYVKYLVNKEVRQDGYQIRNRKNDTVKYSSSPQSIKTKRKKSIDSSFFFCQFFLEIIIKKKWVLILLQIYEYWNYESHPRGQMKLEADRRQIKKSGPNPSTVMAIFLSSFFFSTKQFSRLFSGDLFLSVRIRSQILVFFLYVLFL